MIWVCLFGSCVLSMLDIILLFVDIVYMEFLFSYFSMGFLVIDNYVELYKSNFS